MASDSSVIVVCGSAGVGKSRLGREALSSAAAKGCEIIWVVGTTSARALALGALALWTGAGGSDGLQLVESLTSGPKD
jgi:predicted ATP-dependent serine protease